MMRMSLNLAILVGCACFGAGAHSARIKREPGTGGQVSQDIGTAFLGEVLDVVLPSVPETSSDGCGNLYGCYYGYCWASCQATAFNNEWCYTTRGYSQNFGYVHCSVNRECDKCWACAGSCTV